MEETQFILITIRDITQQIVGALSKDLRSILRAHSLKYYQGSKKAAVY
jgi:hypothetical protein